MAWVGKVVSLFFGLILYAVGIMLTIHAGLGVSPWDAFHLGIVGHSGFTLGQASQVVGLILIVICVLLQEFPGVGTLANMYFIGLFIDIIEANQLIPDPTSSLGQVAMILAGIGIIGWATFFYLGAGLGSGPRDGLMLALSRKLNRKVTVPRTIIELSVLVAGFALGAQVGVGTLLTAFLVGPSIQLTYSLMGRDPRETIHRTLFKTFPGGKVETIADETRVAPK